MRGGIFPGTLQAIFAKVQILLLEFWSHQEKRISPVPAEPLFLLSLLHKVRLGEKHGAQAPGPQSAAEASSGGSREHSTCPCNPTISATANAHCNPCFFGFPPFFSLWINFHLRLGQVVRAIQPGQACWVLSWWRLIKKLKEKKTTKKGRRLHSQLPLTSTFPVSRFVGEWGWS